MSLVKTVEPSPTRTAAPASPLPHGDDKRPEIVLSAWALGEIERELGSLEHWIESVRPSRHPFLHLRLRRQIGELRLQHGEHRAEYETLLDH